MGRRALGGINKGGMRGATKSGFSVPGAFHFLSSSFRLQLKSARSTLSNLRAKYPVVTDVLNYHANRILQVFVISMPIWHFEKKDRARPALGPYKKAAPGKRGQVMNYEFQCFSPLRILLAVLWLMPRKGATLLCE